MSIAIKVENLSKAYQLGQIGTGTISRDMERWFAQIRGKEDPFLKIGETNDRSTKGNSDIVWSLKDINFEIEQGDAVGIIGRNGAGKSTLLKILSKVTAPTTGKISGQGRIASLLEVGTGFHPELSGRENIFLNGAILGMRKKEILRKFDEIVDFAGIERYIDTPVKRYSSGMYVRLAFAVAAHLESEILIVDEVLAVGDAEFQKKCLGKMGEVSKGEGRTVLFVSHNMASIIDLCTSGIYLKNGMLEKQGVIDKVINSYLSNKNLTNYYKKEILNSQVQVYINEVLITNDLGISKSDFFIDEKIHINVNLNMKTSVKADLFILVLDSKKKRVFACESEGLSENIEIILDSHQLVAGSYSLNVAINIPHVMQIENLEDICNFSIIDSSSSMSKHGDYDYGSVFGRYKVVKNNV